ncbi:Ribonucleoside-diphosphate reductase 1 subunit alpha [Paludisphaera borealis]|uniref:Ribonucleoside-diphosphate reductase n=1 Tax=Paludisphaera borealis TaxID=1387353 RepID=A0A1U7CWW5_9BACT|nr:ribonucleotide reductase N-terminal alpha domain-containing protein [Paludisphaera borealis]APW63388.1 Ribonucleoside-diphosphate reductase 1 subunit alpha [Paludisphaera borealis]
MSVEPLVVAPENGTSPHTVKPPAQSAAVAESGMHVRKRNGGLEPVDVNKIVRAVQRSVGGLPHVDIMRIAVKTIGGLFDGATTRELDRLSIQTAASLIAEEPEYSQLAARLLDRYIDKEVRNQDIHSFSQSVAVGHRLGLVSTETARFVASNARKLNSAADRSCDLFEYFGLRTVYDRYLLRHPVARDVTETPSYFFLRVACGLSTSVNDALSLFELMAAHRYLPSSPTLFNSGTPRSQMSSCYLLDSPGDDLEDIYARYADVARLSKYAGGIGLAYHRIRSRGSLIRGTNGHSNGIVPWLKTLDSSVAAVNQGGGGKGRVLSTWRPGTPTSRSSSN